MIIQEIKDILNGTTRRRTIIKTTIGTTIGVLMGAAAGILLAPKSGKATRKAIKAAALKGAENAAETARRAVLFTKKEADAVIVKVDDLKTQLKHSKKSDKEAVEDLADDI